MSPVETITPLRPAPVLLPPLADEFDEPVADLVLPLAKASRPGAVLLGVPFDATTMGRGGSRHAPAAVRAALAGLLSYHAGFDADLRTGGVLADAGDIDALQTNVEETWRRITDAVTVLLSTVDAPLVVLGGDNSLTFPVLRGAVADPTRRLGVVHFDAHFDVRPSHHGEPASGVPIRLAVEKLNGRVRGQNITQIGIAGWENTKAAADYVAAQGIRVYSAREVQTTPVEKLVDEAVSRALDGTDGMWISVDIDAVDGAFAPGTNCPTVGGLTSHQMLELVWRLAQVPQVVGLDLSEVSPPLDRDGITVQLAATTILTFLAARTKSGQGA
jgi:agmatinase